MPPVCMLVNDANLNLAPNRIDAVDQTLFAPGADLIQAVETLGWGTAEEREFFATYPAEALEQIRDEVYRALTASPRTPLAFAWIESGQQEVVVSAMSNGRSITIGGPAHGPASTS